MDDIIFENREKRYGAYFIRKNIHWHEWVALALICGWVWSAFWAWNLREVESDVVSTEQGANVVILSIVPMAPPPKEKYNKNLITCFRKSFFHMPVPVPKECACDILLFRHELEVVESEGSLEDSTAIISYITQSCGCEDYSFNPLPQGEDIEWRPHYVFDDDLANIVMDSLLNEDFFYTPPSINEPAQLINPEIIPQNIQRKLQKQRISISIQIDPAGNYLAHRLEGKLSKRLEAPFAEMIEKLRFTPDIRAGKASSAWVEL